MKGCEKTNPRATCGALRRPLIIERASPKRSDDKVYSEIAANLRVDNTVQQHVPGHLRDFVAVTPRRHVSGWRALFRGGLWYQPLYVDTVTGLLCRTDRLPEEKARQRARRAKPAPPIERINLDDNCELRLIAGIWYKVTLAPLPKPVYRVQREN